MNQKKTTGWREIQAIQDAAGREADQLASRLCLSAPIDPLEVARTEYPRLRVGGRDFGGSFDGKLKYNREQRCFLLMYNDKYDVGFPSGRHHPRTRFSISHELGHFFLERHHQYLRSGGRPHRSINEFRSDVTVEREADAFAANLLLPTHLVNPIVNRRELSLERLDEIAAQFETSLVSTAIRAARLSHFPCAVAGIRDAAVAWMFPSESLIKAGIYPRRGILPECAAEQWDALHDGRGERVTHDGTVSNWFQTFERDHLDELYVSEEYHPISVMGTLLVLLTLDERDLNHDDDPDEWE